MSKVIAIAWKDIKIRSSGKTELLFFIILPVIFTVLLSGMFFGSGSSKIVMVVVDEDNSALSQQLVRMLQASQVVAPSLMTRENAQSAFDKGNAAAILIIPPGMEAGLKAGQPVAMDFNQNPADNSGLAAEQEVQKVISQIGRNLAAAQTESATSITRIIVTQPANTLKTQNQQEAQAAQASAGELIIWVFIPLLGTSELMASERVWGTLRRLVTTPTRKPTFLLGMISGQFSYGLVQMLLLVVIGVLLLKVPWGQNPLALLLLLISFGLAAVAMGIMLGTFTRTPSQASGMSIALGMVMGLLGGCMLPLEMFPPAVANVAKVLPTTWAMMGMTQLTVYNAGLIEILPYAAVLIGFALVFFVVGVLRFRYE
jgi:linearmycin/streptolysin S transport system permease protein